jgi:hypothetical protein
MASISPRVIISQSVSPGPIFVVLIRSGSWTGIFSSRPGASIPPMTQ